MSLAALIEAIQPTVPPSIIGLTIAALDGLEKSADAGLQPAADAPSGQGVEMTVAVEQVVEPTVSIEDEIKRLDTSSKRTFNRRYRKLCEETRRLVDAGWGRLPSLADVPDDHRGEAYFHDEDAHYANGACGYCLLELLHDALRESRCVCHKCDDLRRRHLHYAGACECVVCSHAISHEHLNTASGAAGRYVVPVTRMTGEMCGL